MKGEATKTPTLNNLRFSRLMSWNYLWLGCLLATALPTAIAGPKLVADSPIGFFTNCASRLLSSQLNLNLTQIQVYPTNQYTPSVHRLLQVTAILFESTTSNLYPCIYRPYFTAQGTNIFISGYEEVDATNSSLLTLPVELSDAASSGSISNDTRINIYGIPWIIGAKKGIPNFNEVAMNSLFEISRRLAVTRHSLIDPVSSYSYQQQYILAVSNAVAVEVWNSYRTNFVTPVDIVVHSDLSYTLTNSDGVAVGNRYVDNFVSTASQWPGYGSNQLPVALSFIVPMVTNYAVVANLVYNHAQRSFLPNLGLTAFEPVSGSINWGLNATNRLRVIIRESATGRVLDYVQLNGMTSSRDFNSEVLQSNSIIDQSLWDPNVNLGNGLMNGINYQLQASFGYNQLGPSIWAYYGLNQPPVSVAEYAIDTFRAFYHLAPIYGHQITNTNLVQQVPFTPTLEILRPVSWQANDPLVHYLSSDLYDPVRAGTITLIKPPGLAYTNFSNIGVLNYRYLPWGGNPLINSWDPTAFDISVKDPAVWSPDDWDFPTNQPLSLDWIGRVHRGTPWQTLYLKSPVANSTEWQNWTGLTDAGEAQRTHPNNDWRLAGLLASLLQTNDPRQLLSVNDPNPNDWLQILDGLSALTNSSSLQLDPLVISSNSPQAAIIVNALSQARAAQTSHGFQNAGDLLATPELSGNSPFVNTNTLTSYTAGGLTDEALEIIPSQLLALLRADSIVSVSSSNGQPLLQFSGDDGSCYAVETSSNLVDWVSLATNSPVNGIFSIPISFTPNVGAQFFRSSLLP